MAIVGAEGSNVPAITLYIAPGSCSRVPLIALCEIGVAFDTALVRFMRGEHKSSAYKEVNPKGKVPALVVGGNALTENVAILSFLNRMYPAAGLLPAAATPMDEARQIADLSFCSSTLHPIVTRIRMPAFFAAPEAAPDVWEKGCAAMHEYFQLIENRLVNSPWWYGETWSVMDAYLNWVFWRVEGADFPVSDFPHFADHSRRIAVRPSFVQAMEIEAQANTLLEAKGLAIKPPS